MANQRLSKRGKLSRFESLPGELRNEIYRYLLDPGLNRDDSKPRSDLIIDPLAESGITITNSFAIHTGILRANRRIYQEAQGYLYEKLGPVVTVNCNFFGYIYKRLYDNQYLAWNAKGDRWKDVYGREAHLSVRYTGVSRGLDRSEGTLVLLGMQEIEDFAKWLQIIETSKALSYSGLQINWNFNESLRSALKRPSLPGPKTTPIRRAILDLFASVRGINTTHSIENTPQTRFIKDYLARANSPIFWFREAALRSIEILYSFEQRAYGYFKAGNLEKAISIYEQLPHQMLANYKARDDFLPMDIPLEDPDPWRTLHRLRHIMRYNYLLAKSLCGQKPGPYYFNILRQHGDKKIKPHVTGFTEGFSLELFCMHDEIELTDRLIHMNFILRALTNLKNVFRIEAGRKFKDYLTTTSNPDWERRAAMLDSYYLVTGYGYREDQIKGGDDKILISHLPTEPWYHPPITHLTPSPTVSLERAVLRQLSYKGDLYTTLLPSCPPNFDPNDNHHSSLPGEIYRPLEYNPYTYAANSDSSPCYYPITSHPPSPATKRDRRRLQRQQITSMVMMYAQSAAYEDMTLWVSGQWVMYVPRSNPEQDNTRRISWAAACARIEDIEIREDRGDEDYWV
ncbi:hypothetical protein ABW19_dt0209615 [Dactylella cylindrospora]|nr:hypothetical protein ABW19_dt0209615 [Dactylella cylindrospora]